MLRLARTSMWTLAAALLAGAAVSWPALPDVIPTHFGLTGEPDAWGEKSLAFWFGLPLMALALVALMDWTATKVRRRPESPLVSLPNKSEILNAPPARRARALAWSATGLYLSGVCVVLALGVVQAGIWHAAHGGDVAGWMSADVVLAVAGPLAAVFWTSAKARAVVREGGTSAR